MQDPSEHHIPSRIETDSIFANMHKSFSEAISELFVDSDSKSNHKDVSFLEFPLTFDKTSQLEDSNRVIFRKGAKLFKKNENTTNDEKPTYVDPFFEEFVEDTKRDVLSESRITPNLPETLSNDQIRFFSQSKLDSKEFAFQSEKSIKRRPHPEGLQGGPIADSRSWRSSPKKPPNCGSPDDVNFDHLKVVLMHVFTGKETRPGAVPKLNFKEKIIIEHFLWRIFKKKLRFHEYNYSFQNLRRKIDQKRSKRSPEEFIKKIYRPFLRSEFERFKEHCSDYQQRLQSDHHPASLYEDKMKAFYCFLFIDMENTNRQYLDLYLDILTEKTNRLVFKKKALSRRENWETIPKAKFPTKISKSLRYLVTANEQTRARFESFLKTHQQQAFSEQLVAKIRDDLNLKIEKVRELYRGFENFEDFQVDLGNMLFDKKFKLKWPLWEIDEAVSFCRSDLDSWKLEKEFIRIKSKHYSFIN